MTPQRLFTVGLFEASLTVTPARNSYKIDYRAILTQSMKARYKYRFYPTDQQRLSLAQLFGCVRVVWNDGLAFCKQSEKLPTYNQLSARLTCVKKTPEREWLNDVSSVPLQQSLRHLATAYKNFFDFRKGKRKGVSVGLPKFKKKTNNQSAEFAKNAFSIAGECVYLAKIGNIKPVWSRVLPSVPSSVTVIKDYANRYFVSFVVIVSENQVIVLEDLNVSGMMKNRKLSRAISLQGWYQFRVFCEAKSDKFGREFKVINRWEPTSQICADCGYRWGKLDLSVRKIICLNCGANHDRDGNAAKNIVQVGMGYRHDSKRTQREGKTTCGTSQ